MAAAGALAGGYHDVKPFRETLLARLLDVVGAGALRVERARRRAAIRRALRAVRPHVSVWVKKEKIRNRVTGEYEEPDERMMREVERLLGVKGGAEERASR